MSYRTSLKIATLFFFGWVGSDGVHGQKLAARYSEWLNEEVVYIIDPSERKEFLELMSDQDRDGFIRDFWRLRDTDISTEINEYKLEHEQRIRYSNEHFHSGRAGWRTERGRIYITHGPPDSVNFDLAGDRLLVRVRTPTEVLTGGSGDRRVYFPVELVRPESEVWVYRHLPQATSTTGFFQVIFSRANPEQLYSLNEIMKKLGDGSLSYQQRLARDNAIMAFKNSQTTMGPFKILYAGDYRFQGVDDFFMGILNPGLAPAFDRFDLLRAMRDLSRTPGEVLHENLERESRLREAVGSRVFFDEFTPDLTHAFVRAESGLTLIPFVLGIPQEFSGDRLDVIVELERPDGAVAAKVLDTMQIHADNAEIPEAAKSAYVYQGRLSVRPGLYKLKVYGLVENRRALSYLEKEVEVPDFGGREFAMSDVLFFDEVFPKVEKTSGEDSPSYETRFLGTSSPLAVQDHVLIPALDSRFRRKQQLTAVFEVYNPGVSEEKQEPVLDLQCRLRFDGRIVATFPVKVLDYLTDPDETPGGRGRTTYGLTIPLVSLRTGSYELEFEVLDQVLGKRTSKVTAFQVY
jgi:GWxTD domain-containing protein